ncbi:MAG: transglutaminase domain-containing protein [Candidatus Helarchaeota archaeon]|nr:transglutaminase domain-containing protein [Candidatus Helarchaeota archaeon]
MEIQVDLANTLSIQSGMLQAGYLTWSLYGESEHQSVEIIQKRPAFQIREMGEKNYGGYIKLPSLHANDEFQFKATLIFSTKTLKFPILNFRFNTYSKTYITQYCRSAKFWETNDPELTEIAKNLLSESGDDVLINLHKAFEFVHDNIKFRENQNHRLGARLALKEGKGDCDEFSDLFITLCRINHIPAQRVMGILVTDANNYSLHAWSEVYIPLYGQWVPFDVALDEFASIKWNYLIRAHMGLKYDAPLVFFRSKVGKNFRAKFEEDDVAQVSLIT